MKTGTITTIDQKEMPYFSFGSGKRAMVILPGLGVKSVLASAKAVEAAYRVFSDDYTVYVLDRPRVVSQGYSVRDAAADAAEAMSLLDIKDADVFGASMGGMIAQYLALDHPDSVHAMVLGSTTAYCSDEIRSTCEKWIALAEARDISGLTADFIDRLYSDDTIKRFKDLLIHMNDNATDEEIARFIIMAESIFGFDIRDDLRKIQCPVFVIGVEDDLAVGVEASREIAQALDCESYIYSNQFGHCVFDEAPDYKERLYGFFKAHW